MINTKNYYFSAGLFSVADFCLVVKLSEMVRISFWYGHQVPKV
jgi:hypothetical protein